MTIDQQTLQAMIKDPAAHFDTPATVLSTSELGRDDKVAILESWLVDERELAKATEENMGDSDSNRLAEVTKALQSLDAD